MVPWWKDEIKKLNATKHTPIKLEVDGKYLKKMDLIDSYTTICEPLPTIKQLWGEEYINKLLGLPSTRDKVYKHIPGKIKQVY